MATLMFQDREVDALPKLKMSCTSVGVTADDGTSKYTNSIRIRQLSRLKNYF